MRGWSAAVCVVGGLVFRVCVDNFTVDASIFVDFDKLLSAVGGCLGTKSR